MTGKDAFKIWAETGVRWVDWVRPVPFVTMANTQSLKPAVELLLPSIIYIAEPQENVAIIIDMPGDDSIKEGIALAKMGFRPIPLYNGAKGQKGAMALVDHRTIENALRWGAAMLEDITLPENAPPVFLLDSNRTHRYKMNVSVFDNSWDIYAQDMPSAETFLKYGVDSIIIRGETIQKDLSSILYGFQKKGITILFTNGYDEPKKVILKVPARKHN